MHLPHLFEHQWISVGAVPPKDTSCIDVAVLDMNWGMPNLGHDALVGHLETIVHGFAATLEASALRVRALTFDVRRACHVPAHDGRFQLYIGTGGPGHLDPHLNDGVAPWAQGVDERHASWETPLFDLFDAVRDDPACALIGICHSFGLLCRWSGIATPVLRGPEKGGKSTGIVGNLLTDDARTHPWFQTLASEAGEGKRISVTDSRLFDLLPTGKLDSDATVIAHEENGVALTMVEFARGEDGTPRMLAMNHHPEIVNPSLLRSIMREKLAANDVDEAWVDERQRIIDRQFADRTSEIALETTSEAVLFGPIRTHLERLVRCRTERLQHPSTEAVRVHISHPGERRTDADGAVS